MALVYLKYGVGFQEISIILLIFLNSTHGKGEGKGGGGKGGVKAGEESGRAAQEGRRSAA